MLELDNAVVYHGNNLDVLPTLPDNSVDSIVTDPPYELGFMGKSWDNSGIAYSVELWTECMRVLKPGGHLLAFGGSRTWHRLAVAIEDAGFEMRDSIAWLYGSGFPKSMDISKAIDKGQGQNQARQLQFVNWMRSTGMTANQANKILQEVGAISSNGTMAGHFFSESQAAIATAEIFDCLKPYLPEVPEQIERLVAERTGIEWTAYKNREVIGKKDWSNSANHFVPGENHSERVNLDITAPATPEAKQWQGWGTALKPAFEPVVVARKPLGEKTVAANVLKYGTGGLNIDGSRIGTEDKWQPSTRQANDSIGTFRTNERTTEQHPQGRWPANIILDPYTAELLDEQSGQTGGGKLQIGAKPRTNIGHKLSDSSADRSQALVNYGDSGGASRFFYVAKASKRDRNEGLEKLPTKGKVFNGQNPESAGMADGSVEDKFSTQPAQNFHPTVKPTSLMTYLIKLVTPEGGTVLDPFTGSGSTGKAALLNGFKFIGIELTDEYLPIIEGRLRWANEQANQPKEGLF